MSDRERLEQAKALIRAKRYTQARHLLASINHPTARRWEQQLNAIAPRHRLRWILAALLLALLAAALTVPGFVQMQNEQAAALNEALHAMQTDVFGR